MRTSFPSGETVTHARPHPRARAPTAGGARGGAAGGAGRDVVDVRRYPGSRHNPQFNKRDARGRLAAEPGEERFGCIRVAAFRAYAARMGTPPWQAALERSLARPAPCFMCSETPWPKCHRRLIAELLHARGHEVRHLVSPGRTEAHVPWTVAEAREGRLYLCGEAVA